VEAQGEVSVIEPAWTIERTERKEINCAQIDEVEARERAHEAEGARPVARRPTAASKLHTEADPRSGKGAEAATERRKRNIGACVIVVLDC
jgi:hypothetical protein